MRHRSAPIKSSEQDGHEREHIDEEQGNADERETAQVEDAVRVDEDNADTNEDGGIHEEHLDKEEVDANTGDSDIDEDEGVKEDEVSTDDEVELPT